MQAVVAGVEVWAHALQAAGLKTLAQALACRKGLASAAAELPVHITRQLGFVLVSIYNDHRLATEVGGKAKCRGLEREIRLD